MAYSGTILAEASLIGYWKLDEPSGTIATDSKSGLSGTYNGGFTLNQAAYGSLQTKSTLFNGSTGYMAVPTNAALHPTTAVSVEAWIKPAALPGTSMNVAGCGFSAGGSPFIDYELAVDTTSKVAFQLGTSGTVATFVTAPTALVVGNWYHLLGTYNGTTACLYINGALVTSTPLTGAINNSGQTFTVGRYQRGAPTGEYFNGNVSDVAVYNTALSASAVLAHYNAISTHTAILSQLVSEVLYTGNPSSRLSQVIVEVLAAHLTSARQSQVVVEILATTARQAANKGVYAHHMGTQGMR